MFMTIILGACAFWLLFQSLINRTRNFISALNFKVVPFFLGLASLVAFLGRLGILVL